MLLSILYFALSLYLGILYKRHHALDKFKHFYFLLGCWILNLITGTVKLPESIICCDFQTDLTSTLSFLSIPSSIYSIQIML